jgi:asparagine synthetase B (glutamine-hydrolysing)
MDGRTVITVADLGACLCILRRVLDARSRLAAECERAQAASYKPDGAIWSEILAWIEKTPRRDKVLEKIARRPPQYRRVFDEMVAQRAITSGKDESTGKYILRIATAEELEQGEEQAETRRAAVNTETRQIQASRRAYAECSDEDKEARVLAYVERWRMDNALTEGNRNIALNKLAWSMQGAGLWDAVARQIYDIIAANSGLGEAEIRSLMRARKKRGTP